MPWLDVAPKFLASGGWPSPALTSVPLESLPPCTPSTDDRLYSLDLDGHSSAAHLGALGFAEDRVPVAAHCAETSYDLEHTKPLASGRRWFEDGHQRFSALDDGKGYFMEDVIGEGSYGSVYRCCRQEDSAVFAVKIIDLKRVAGSAGEGAMKSAEVMALGEVDALRRAAAHPHIVALEAALIVDDQRQLFIVTEFLPGGDLFSHLALRTQPLLEPEAAHIVAQVSSGLAFCHKLGIAHRDLKLENLLVERVSLRATVELWSPDWHSEELFDVKICDFGFARVAAGCRVGTAIYAAPEILDGDPGSGWYDMFKADAFALGVATFVLLCRSYPRRDRYCGSLHRAHPTWRTLSADARTFLDGLLTRDAAGRLGVAEAADHHWLADSQLPTGILSRQESDFSLLQRPPQPQLRRCKGCASPLLPALLSLHRGLVSLQRERDMAASALEVSATSCRVSDMEQFRFHANITGRRLQESVELVEHCTEGNAAEGAFDELGALLSDLVELRHNILSPHPDKAKLLFDTVFSAYSRNCSRLVNIIEAALIAVHPESEAARKAARRYRLLTLAAEQLGRERSFLCGRGCWSSDGQRRMMEILGARKVLLGTATEPDAADACDIVTAAGAPCGGLVGELLMEDGEPCLLNAADIASLEKMEHHIHTMPAAGDTSSDENRLPQEWYHTITRLMQEIHSRTVIGLIDDLQLAPPNAGDATNEQPLLQPHPTHRRPCGCAGGFKRLFCARH